MTHHPRKILLMITQAGLGGAQRSVLALAQALQARGQPVELAFGPGDFLPSAACRQGLPFRKMNSLRRSLNPWPNLKLIWETKQICDREEIDVLHLNSSNTLPAAIGARWSKRPPKVVFTFRGLSVLDESYQSAPVRLFFRLIFRVLLRYVDEPVFVSRANFEAAKRLKIVQTGRVVYNGLDPESLIFWTKAQARKNLQQESGQTLTEKDFLIGSIGRLAYQKNYSFLIRQMAELRQTYPKIKVVIIGGGPEEEKLKREIVDHQLSDVFWLLGERSEAFKYLPAFDLFVLPSRYEGLSITLIEVLMAGIPALVSDVGGAREQFEQALFQVFPLNNSEVFQSKLSRLMSNLTLRAELTDQNLQAGVKFHITHTADQYLDIYTSRT